MRSVSTSLTNVNMSYANLIGARLEGTIIKEAIVTGANTWGVHINAETVQKNLVIEEVIYPLEEFVDDTGSAIKNIKARTNSIETAYILALIANKEKFRTVIEAFTGSLVLLLGNFGLRRMAVLKKISGKLTELGYTPVIFDFPPPNNRTGPLWRSP